ncbi:twin-arginine translocation signal domain-containing protein [Microbulbifer hydrolyticus]
MSRRDFLKLLCAGVITWKRRILPLAFVVYARWLTR